MRSRQTRLFERRTLGLATAATVLGLLLSASSAQAAVEFADSAVPVSGGKPLDVALGDVDGANGPDIVASINQSGTGSLAVRLNQGDGTFAPETLYPLGCVAHQVELTDLGGTNGDNTPDGALDAALFCVDSNSGRIGRIAGDGRGAFLGPAALPSALVAPVGDGLGIEGGFQRMALAQIRAPGLPLAPMWTYYYNACAGSCFTSTICTTYDWQAIKCFSSVNGYPRFYPPVAAGTVADARVFGTSSPGTDGTPDTRRLVAFGNFPGAGAPPETRINGTERDFGPSPGTQLPAWKSIAIGDLAGDGPDMITAEGVCGCIGSPSSPAAGRVSVLPGTTEAGVPPDTTPVTVGSVPGVLSVEVGDIDGDGKQDVAGTSHTNNGNAVFVHLGNGAGGLGQPVALPVGGQPSAYSRAPITLRDVDRDGRLDVVVITDEIRLLTNRSTPTGSSGSTPPPGTDPSGSGDSLDALAGISGLKQSAKVGKNGVVKLGTAQNPPTSSVAIAITGPKPKPKAAKPPLFGKAKIAIPPGATKPLKVALKSNARKLLEKGKLKAKLELVAVATDGTKKTLTRALRIKPAK